MTLGTTARQAPRSMGLSRQEDWSGLPCESEGVSYQVCPTLTQIGAHIEVNYLLRLVIPERLNTFDVIRVVFKMC